MLTILRINVFKYALRILNIILIAKFVYISVPLRISLLIRTEEYAVRGVVTLQSINMEIRGQESVRKPVQKVHGETIQQIFA